MTILSSPAFVEDYRAFIAEARPFVQIADETGYEQALEALESVLELADDTPDDPMNPLIDMLSRAIEQYETQDTELAAFLSEAEATSADIALLKTLMAQHHLTGSDLPEIGGKAMVSKVLSGQRELSRKAIEALAERFGVRPAMFFGG